MSRRAPDSSSFGGVRPAADRLRRVVAGLAPACAALFLVFAAPGVQGAVERFPPPDLGEAYEYPQSFQAPPRSDWTAVVDTATLFAALVTASLVLLHWRSRRAVVWLNVFALVYFGFYRGGCVCPIGSIQNVAAALAHPDQVLPWVVLAFFTLPLLFALLCGRVFCAAVCPLGAMQELVLLKPLKVPRALDRVLGVLRHFYLGLAVLFAVLGARYIICQYDPFVAFFRMSGRYGILIWSVALLLLSTVVFRPYCRYLCPYAVLLNWLSRFSVRHVTITPDRCIVCGLCEDACPMDAIHEGGAEHEDGRASR